MNIESSYDFTKFFTGPDLLLNNAFRLTQMPVDTPERTLNRRQKLIETANKIGISPATGESPIFAISDGNGADGTKEAIHRLQDPLNRLLDEFFWFWPRSFGHSSTDNALKFLEKDEVENAIKHWKQGEQETENFVSTHNLAILYQFMALQIDEQLIAIKEPPKKKMWGLLGFNGNKDEKLSRRYWKESLSRWHILSKQDSFWMFLKNRINSINDPRLPLQTADWLRSKFTAILFSVNAGMIINAAEKKSQSAVEHQHKIIMNSGFDSKDIDAVFETLTRKYVQKIQHLCKTSKSKANDDPVKADIPACSLAEQATNVLQTLDMIFQKNDRTVSALYDQVAETILHCQVIHGNKTEDWEKSIELLRVAQPLTRGKTAKERIADNIKRVEEQIESGNIWCEPGYFDLPPECIDALERARAYEESGQYNEAIDLLRQVLLGILELPDHIGFNKHLHRCIAYCFKSKSIVIYNRAMAEYDNKVKKVLLDNLKCDGLIGNGFGICARCKGRFYGSYVNRTIGGHTFPFCISCNEAIKRKFENLDEVLDEVKIEALELMLLANEFDPEFKPVIRNLTTIRESAEESHLRVPATDGLKLAWNLLPPNELIRQLTATSCADASKIFDTLSKIISRQSAKRQKSTLNHLFVAILKDDSIAALLLPIIKNDPFILSMFERFGLQSRNKMSRDIARKMLVFLLGANDARIRGKPLDTLLKKPGKVADIILKACGTEDKQQGTSLCRLVDVLSKVDSYRVDISFDVLKRSLLAVKIPALSDSILRLCEAGWPNYVEMMMDKRCICDMKYLEKEGNDLQRKISSMLLQSARDRGIWLRFKIWSKSPSSSYQAFKDEEIWWSR